MLRARGNAACLLWLVLGMLALLSLGGCVNTQRGDTLYRVKAASLEEEKAIRRQLWRVGRAVEDVRVRYALDNVTVQVEVTDLQGLGATTPAFTWAADVSGAKVLLNKRLFLSEQPELDEILLGLMAHELMHALHYSRLASDDLVTLGQRYSEMMRNPHGKQRSWVRAYERLTDIMTIRMGYGEALIAQKRATEAHLVANEPTQVWDFYLTEPEIRALMADQELLDREAAESLRVLALASARRMYARPLEFDEDGDLVRVQVR